MKNVTENKTPEQARDERVMATMIERQKLRRLVSIAETAYELARHNLCVARQNRDDYNNGLREKEVIV